MLSRAKIRRLEAQVDDFSKLKSRSGKVFLVTIDEFGLIVRHEIDHEEYVRFHPDMVTEFSEESNVLWGVITSDCWQLDCPWHGAHNTLLKKAGRLQELQEFYSLPPSEQLAQICSGGR